MALRRTNPRKAAGPGSIPGRPLRVHSSELADVTVFGSWMRQSENFIAWSKHCVFTIYMTVNFLNLNSNFKCIYKAHLKQQQLTNVMYR